MHSATNTNSIFTDHEEDQSNKRKALVAALIAILLWVVLLLYPVFSYTFPLPEKPGILLSLGDFDGGGEFASANEQVKDEIKELKPESSSKEEDTEEKELSKQEMTSKSVQIKVQEQVDEISIVETTKSEKDSEKQLRERSDGTNLQKIEADRKAKEQQDFQKAKAEAEAEKKKEEEEAKLKEFGSFFSGEGTGEESKKQGNPEGEPDKAKLEGLTTGKSNIGGGLADRGVLYEPDIEDNSQKVGRIVVRVCVNGEGIVTSSKFTQKGSTSTDIFLIEVAEKAASQYRFSASGLEKQCGTISIDFKLK